MSERKQPEEWSIVKDWLTEDGLMLLECWSRDGFTYKDIAIKIGISPQALGKWRNTYPEIEAALQKGREVIDYKVENALLKAALGYQTKEVKVTTTLRYGKVVETIKEVTEKEQAPNVQACQVWLYNRLPSKWKRNRDNIIDLNDEDTKIQVTVTRANKNETEPNTEEHSVDDKEWEEVNQSITIRGKTKEEIEEDKKKSKQKKKEEAQKVGTIIEYDEYDESAEDLDAWPDDWEDED